MQALNIEQLSVRVKGNGVDFRTKQLGELTVSWVKLDKGVDLSGATVGLPEDLCPCPHWGYVIKGRVRMKTRETPRDFAAGEAFYWGPGHAPEALEDSEYVDFSPTKDLEEVIAHITREH
jgi:hypothetical protein